MRVWMALVCLALAGTLGSCAKQEPEPVYQISAEQLDDAIPPGSLAAQLSPAEREALAGQGYEIEIDEDDRELLALQKIEEQAEREAAEKGGVRRAMDHVGKATVAVASVAMAIGMVVAPFFLF